MTRARPTRRSSGTGNGSFSVSVDWASYPLEHFSCELKVYSAEASNSPQTVIVYGAAFGRGGMGESGAPVGSFDTPVDGTPGIAGAIAVTGWALDDIGITKVEIWREPVGYETGLIYISDATFVEGARPDIELLYGAPFDYRAGWGYMLLTNFLPTTQGNTTVGNGTYVLHAYAYDKEGNRTEFGTKTITVDNASATKPFGTIDTPGQGGTVSGTYRNWGWVLTPQPYAIPVDGSTIQVYVDGSLLGTLNYGLSRPDIQSAFPGYQNTDTAVGFFDIDTTAYENGIHTVGWYAVDDGGRAEGIGSRFFVIENPGSSPPDRR